MTRSTKLTYASVELAKELSRRIWEESSDPLRRKRQRLSERVDATDLTNIWLLWDQFEAHDQALFLERTIFLAAARITGAYELNAWCATQYAATIERLNELQSFRYREAGKLTVEEETHATV